MVEVRVGWYVINSYEGMDSGRRQDFDCVFVESICSRQSYDQ